MRRSSFKNHSHVFGFGKASVGMTQAVCDPVTVKLVNQYV